MEAFQTELSKFLDEYGLPAVAKNIQGGWSQFLYLYSKVIAHIPLEVVNESAWNISKIVVKVSRVHDEGNPIRLSWRIHDKKGTAITDITRNLDLEI